MNKEVYTLGVKCDNCKARGEITIAKGVRPEELVCKECGIKAIAEFPALLGFSFGDTNFKETYYADTPTTTFETFNMGRLGNLSPDEKALNAIIDKVNEIIDYLSEQKNE